MWNVASPSGAWHAKPWYVVVVVFDAAVVVRVEVVDSSVFVGFGCFLPFAFSFSSFLKKNIRIETAKKTKFTFSFAPLSFLRGPFFLLE